MEVKNNGYTIILNESELKKLVDIVEFYNRNISCESSVTHEIRKVLSKYK